MLRAMYDFKATFAKTLSFKENEYFVLFQTNTKQKNWWQVVNDIGQLGYIPSNYVTKVKVIKSRTLYRRAFFTIIDNLYSQVQPQFLIDFLDKCIEELNKEERSSEACVIIDKQNLLERLEEKKRQAESGKALKKQAPLPPDYEGLSKSPSQPVVQNNTEGDIRSSSSTGNLTGKSPAEVAISSCDVLFYYFDTFSSKYIINFHLCQEVNSRPTLPRQSYSETLQKSPPETFGVVHRSASAHYTKQMLDSPPEINAHVAYQLLDQVRRNTQLSWELSKVAITVVVNNLRHLLPSSATPRLTTLLKELNAPIVATNTNIEETYDANRLRVIFTELTTCKEDSQQRNWMLYEDESIIVEYIKELTSILV